MAIANRTTTSETEAIEAHLRKSFDRVDAYELMEYCVRVRVIDKRFKGKNRVKRFDMVNRKIRELPEETQLNILMLVALAPGEESESGANFEFEHPSPVEF